MVVVELAADGVEEFLRRQQWFDPASGSTFDEKATIPSRKTYV
ncbi:hypothetical protein [Nocardia brasiliensis]|nr:hypothetical protein [Nocardia brasiliensis]